MFKKLDGQSLFLFTELWGGALLASVWIARRLIHNQPAVVALWVSVPFAVVMFGAMLLRLRDLRWPLLLLVPVCLTYLWILGDNVFFKAGWPINIPRSLVASLGIYSGVLWLLMGIE